MAPLVLTCPDRRTAQDGAVVCASVLPAGARPGVAHGLAPLLRRWCRDRVTCKLLDLSGACQPHTKATALVVVVWSLWSWSVPLADVKDCRHYEENITG